MTVILKEIDNELLGLFNKYINGGTMVCNYVVQVPEDHCYYVNIYENDVAEMIKRGWEVDGQPMPANDMLNRKCVRMKGPLDIMSLGN